MSPKFYIPIYLRELVRRYWDGIENISLQLNKFVPFIEEKRGSGIYKPRIDYFRYKKLPSRAVEDYKKFYQLQRNLWESKLRESGVDPKFLDELRLSTRSRLIVGLGDESVYETSIRLHRNYGVPFIPGSALKGVAKHFAVYNITDENYKFLSNKFGEEDFFRLAGSVQKLLEEPDDRRVENLKSLSFKLSNVEVSFKELRAIFGTQKREGSVIFFDAFPTPEQLNQVPILELDIINPHYQPYYQHGDPPGDWYFPTPIFFLTVPKGVEFQFAIAPRDDVGRELLNKTKMILISALREFGIGAKTSLGYGHF